MSIEPYRIVMADDNVQIRRELRKTLDEREELEVVGEANDGLELLNLLKLQKLAPHMAILDITMPRLSGLQTALRIKEDLPHVKVLILTIHKEREYLDQAISIGVDGYLLKEDSARDLLPAIHAIRQGSIFISPAISVKPFEPK